MKKLLILGASGLVGKAIAAQCMDTFDVYGTYFSSATNLPENKQFQLNVELEETNIVEILDVVQPDITVSCLRGDFQNQLAFHNKLAKELQKRASILYYFSTTNVFDGDLSRHHSEVDTPISNSDYGNFKIDCEKIVVENLGERGNIIRIPGIWGKKSRRLNELRKSEPISVYNNLECDFLLDTQLASQMQFIMKNELSGIFHLAAVDMITQGLFYKELSNKLAVEGENIQYNLLEDKGNIYCFGLLSNREDVPNSLKSTNEEIISMLVD